MSHPYAFPLHHHRNHSSTPSSSMSQLSLNNAYAHQHQAHSSSFGAQTSGSTTSAGPSNRSDMAEASATSTSTTPASTYIAPERRRRRSSRGVGGPSKPPSRKASSAKSIAETKANPDEPLIPTRHYQFKSFESFDPTSSSSSLPTYTSSSTTSLPQGGGYTFGPPPTFAAEAGQGGEALDGHAGTSSSPGTAQQPPKKSKAIFSVGKKVVKEVLGGGGNNTALPPEAKAVYYGRGGAGGAGARASKPPQPSTSTLANGVNPNPPHPPSSGRAASQRCESRQTGSFYTGSSSNYTPSILSSPYAESIASSPNATSVEDGQSVYAPSSYSAPLTMSSLGRPSPSHRSVSPSVSALSEDNWRRDSIVSTTTSYAESSYGSEAADCWQGQAEQQTVWQNPFAGETIQEVERIETPVSMEDSLSPPGGASEGSVTYDGAPAQQAEQPARQVLVPSTLYQQQQVLRHRPSQPSLLSAFPRHSRTQSGHITPSYSSSATSSASSTPYQPSNATNLSTGGGETNLGGLYPMSSAQTQGGGELINGDVVQNGATSAGRLQQVYPTYANGGASVVQQPQQLPSRASAVPQDSLRPPTSPGGGRVSRPLPDPLATAVGQLSLIQNPLSLGWPTPQHQQAQQQQQQQPKQPPLSMLDPTLVSALCGAANGSQFPLNLSNQGTHLPTQQQQQSQPLYQSGTGLLTPNYTIQPQPQPQQQPPPQQQQPQQVAAAAMGVAGAQDYTQSLVYQQALAEQQALARRLAQLERLQQEAARMAAQDPYTNLNSGRGVL